MLREVSDRTNIGRDDVCIRTGKRHDRQRRKQGVQTVTSFGDDEGTIE